MNIKEEGSIWHLASLAGIQTEGQTTNRQLQADLQKFYETPDLVVKIWAELTACERNAISIYVWSEGTVFQEYMDNVAERFGVKRIARNRYYFQNPLMYFEWYYVKRESLFWLLFPPNNVMLFLPELRELIGEMPRNYSTTESQLSFTAREYRLHDFVTMAKWCKANKAVVMKNGLLNKTTALKIQEYCGYEEVPEFVYMAPQEVNSLTGLHVTLPLYELSLIGGLLTIEGGVATMGPKAPALLNLPPAELAKKLYEAYLADVNWDELAVLPEVTRGRRSHKTAPARQAFVNELKKCPLDRPLLVAEFEAFLTVSDHNWARKTDAYVVYTSYSKSNAFWYDYERPLLVLLFSFFGALGMLDIVWGRVSDEEDQKGRILQQPLFFQITPLGAWILGLVDIYESLPPKPVKPGGGFTVLPDYTVVVFKGTHRTKHEAYFAQVLTKVTTTAETSIYKIDFDAILRVLDKGLTIAELRAYLSNSDKPLPENVSRALSDWEKQIGRIRLRQVTVLECDDPVLLAEILHYKGMGAFVQGKISAAAVVDERATKKIKKIIEKQGRFCQDVI
jgi:hypothetical protein